MSRIRDRFLELVRCLAVAPELHGVLFVDLDPLLLKAVGRWLADCAEAGGRGRPRVVTLGSWHTDDDLWSSIRFTDSGLAAGPGLLVENDSEPAAVFLVPDLSTASLAVRRAVVTAAGADSANSERHGFSAVWHPRARWLAACRREALENLPAHLLDRFPIRCDAKGIRSPEPLSPAALDEGALDWLSRLLGPLPRNGTPSFLPEALDRVGELSERAPGMRRDISFARISRAVAARNGSATVSASDVEIAAALLGLIADAAAQPLPEPQPSQRPEPQPTHEPPDPQSGLDEPMFDEEQLDDEWVLLKSGGGPETLNEVEYGGTTGAELFPEYGDDALAEPMSLREWWHRRTGPYDGRGQIIGSQRTKSLRDFAIIPTLLEAHKFRPIRSAGAGGELIIHAGDLRRHRRQPEPTAALVLVLDHSCHRGWDWAPALSSYLRWAYTSRAVVSVVEFGFRGAPQPLRADRYRARNLLDPRVAVSLSREPGSASPLAHAIDLAVDELRHLLRRKRSPAHEALLLMVTDARGNVPFVDSTIGAVTAAVGTRGVTDALDAAKAVGQLRGVRAVVLTPDLAPYPHLVFDLADALSGRVTSPASQADPGRPR